MGVDAAPDARRQSARRPFRPGAVAADAAAGAFQQQQPLRAARKASCHFLAAADFAAQRAMRRKLAARGAGRRECSRVRHVGGRGVIKAIAQQQVEARDGRRPSLLDSKVVPHHDRYVTGRPTAFCAISFGRRLRHHMLFLYSSAAPELAAARYYTTRRFEFLRCVILSDTRRS